MRELLFPTYQPGEALMPADGRFRNMIIVVRADPIICGHSTEARNLAEAALERGIENVHIVTYPLDTLKSSGLPLKPIETIDPYSEGITVARPEPVGNYKVLDGRLGLGIGGHIIDLLYNQPGRTLVMDLYLVPHGQMVMNAVRSFDGTGTQPDILTVAEAVGSDITNVVNNAVNEGRYGAAQMVLSTYLDHELPVAVSQFTKDMILDSARKVDQALDTNFTGRIETRVRISYPAIDTSGYVSLDQETGRVAEVLRERQLDKGGYLMFLSRVAAAKGVDDLINAYRKSDLYGKKELLICGNGPALEDMRALAGGDANIRFLTDVCDEEKGPLMHAAYSYLLPSKARSEFVETFGIAVAEKMLAGGLGPVVTTRTGGIPEATGGYCLEHEAGDAEDLTRCLNQLAKMSTEEKATLNRKAREYALQFDRGQVLNNLLEMGKMEQAA